MNTVVPSDKSTEESGLSLWAHLRAALTSSSGPDFSHHLYPPSSIPLDTLFLVHQFGVIVSPLKYPKPLQPQHLYFAFAAFNDGCALILHILPTILLLRMLTPRCDSDFYELDCDYIAFPWEIFPPILSTPNLIMLLNSLTWFWVYIYSSLCLMQFWKTFHSSSTL